MGKPAKKPAQEKPAQEKEAAQPPVRTVPGAA
jgi:hypothetical protein